MKNNDFAQTVKSLMFAEPFYGNYLSALNKVWNEDIPTMRISLSNLMFYLEINPDFFNKLDDLHKLGALKHELLHIVFFHATAFDHLTDREIANIAFDLEVNQYIDKSMMHPNWLTLDMFSDLRLEPKKGANYYYKMLLNASPQSKSGKLISEIRQSLRNKYFSVDAPNGEKVELTDHEWEETSNEFEKGFVESQVKKLIKEVSETVKNRGLVPGEITDILDSLVKEEPKFDWRAYLRRFAGRCSEVDTRKRRRKPNLRFPDNPGIKIIPRKHILVAVDTSGSVSDSELNDFFSEIDHISRTGTQITVLQCDSAIHSIEKYRRNIPIKCTGRGGTEFQPVIDYYNESRKLYSSLIYFTDGECSAPTKPIGSMLWVISSKSNMNPNLIGPQIQLN